MDNSDIVWGATCDVYVSVCAHARAHVCTHARSILIFMCVRMLLMCDGGVLWGGVRACEPLVHPSCGAGQVGAVGTIISNQEVWDSVGNAVKIGTARRTSARQQPQRTACSDTKCSLGWMGRAQAHSHSSRACTRARAVGMYALGTCTHTGTYTQVHPLNHLP